MWAEQQGGPYNQNIYCLSSVQFISVAQSCLTLCNPMNHSTPGLPVHHQLPEFTQIQVHRVGDAIQPSHPMLSPSPPAPNPSQHQSLFQWVNSSHEVSIVYPGTNHVTKMRRSALFSEGFQLGTQFKSSLVRFHVWKTWVSCRSLSWLRICTINICTFGNNNSYTLHMYNAVYIIQFSSVSQSCRLFATPWTCVYFIYIYIYIMWGFPGDSSGKESACNSGDPGSVPESGRSPGEGNGNPLQYSCLENPMNRGVWWATVHGIRKELDTTEWLTLSLFIYYVYNLFGLNNSVRYIGHVIVTLFGIRRNYGTKN